MIQCTLSMTIFNNAIDLRVFQTTKNVIIFVVHTHIQIAEEINAYFDI